MPAVFYGIFILAIITAYAIPGKRSNTNYKRAIAFLISQGLSARDFVNARGLAAGCVARAMRKGPVDITKSVILASLNDMYDFNFQPDSTFDDQGHLIVFSMPVLVDPLRGDSWHQGYLVPVDHPRVAAALEATVEFYADLARRAAERAERQAKKELAAVNIVADALRLVATENTDLGRVIASALAL